MSDAAPDGPRVLILGYSHTRMIARAIRPLIRKGRTDLARIEICWLETGTGNPNHISYELARDKVAALRPEDLLVLSTHGVYHHVIGLMNHDIPFALAETLDGPLPVPQGATVIPLATMRASFQHWVETDTTFDYLAEVAACPVAHFCPPPPKDSLIPHPSGLYRGRAFAEVGFAPKPGRLALWRLEVDVVTRHLARSGAVELGAPPEALTAEGYLADAYLEVDMTHANAAYGALLLDRIVALRDRAPDAPTVAHSHQETPRR